LVIDLISQDYFYGNKLLKDACNKWEESVLNDTPDYSLYNSDVYLTESFNCWKNYSHKYLLLIKKYMNSKESKIDIRSIKSIIDLGCGNSYTTIGLSAMFPMAKVYGTNLSNTLQFKLNKEVTSNISNCEIIDESMNGILEPYPDLVFASEFFEHLTEPLKLLRTIILKNPKYIIFANTFTKMSLGHFLKYYDNNNIYTGKTISRLFHQILKQSHYVRLNTGFFNNRPYIYTYAKPHNINKLF